MSEFMCRSYCFSSAPSQFMGNIMNDTVYPIKWFSLEAHSLNSRLPGNFLFCNYSLMYDKCGSEISGIRNRFSPQEDTTLRMMTKQSKVRSGHILVISRDPTFVNFLRSIFGNRGYDISAIEADEHGLIGVVNEIQPDLVIVDILMPLMTGVRKALLIRLYTSIPTILLSNWQSDSNTLRHLQVYNPSGLSTPISIEEVVRLVDSVMMRYEDENSMIL